MNVYLVTGVAGFIGSSIARALLARGEQVRGIDNFSTGKRENLLGMDGLQLIEGDIVDPNACTRACEGVRYIFHEAAIASVPRSVADPISTNTANVCGTLQLLMSAREAGAKRIVYAGSSSVYGDSPTLPKHEGMVPNPISPYAVSKLAAEHYMGSFFRVYGLETVTLRYFNVFGPHQDPTSQYSGVLAKFIPAMLRGHQPTVYGDGEQSRDFTYIDNVVDANLLAMQAPSEVVAGRVFNVATGNRITLNDTTALLKKITGYEGPIAHAPERVGDVKHSLADIRAAQLAFGYAPSVDVVTGLQRTVAWYRRSLAAPLPD